MSTTTNPTTSSPTPTVISNKPPQLPTTSPPQPLTSQQITPLAPSTSTTNPLPPLLPTPIPSLNPPLSINAESSSFKDILTESNKDLVEEIYLGLTDEEDVFDDCLSDTEDSLEEGIPKICFSKEEKQQMRSEFRYSLIIKLYKKSVGYLFLHQAISTMWKSKGQFDLIDLGHFLTIRKWVPDFRPEEANLSQVATWIQLIGLPNEYFIPNFLKRIGNSIGKCLRIDQITATRKKGKYARLCIQLNQEEPLLAKIQLGNSCWW